MTAGRAVPPGDDGADLAAGYIARWRPSSLSPQAAAFARDVIAQVAPEEKERAKNLLWAAGKLAGFGIGLGLDAVPEVLLHPSVAERFTRCAPGLSGVARRTLRTNLRFIGRRVVPQLYPADMPLPREHAKEPYSPAEIAGYLALADAQPTPQRRMRASGLVCLGAGAGLIRADLRADHRPAHLTRVHQALTTLPEDDQRRLGVIADWKHGPHQLTYRQTERTFGLVANALAKDIPGGLPSARLQRICDDLLEASIPEEFKDASTSLAVDWTDVETFSRPPSRGTSDCADPEASWGHRSGGGPGQDSELFFGYYASAATMMRDEHGPPVPELARRMTACSCRHDPARALVPVLTQMPRDGIPLGDILSDSGYAHRDAEAWAIPLRDTGAQLVQDLHPSDRGPRGTHHGAIIANGNLYCPATPTMLLELAPLARDATPEQAAAHDQQTAETARYKLGKITSDDHDGYHRVMCPAVMGKLRCPLRPASMRLDRSRPEILTPPEHPPACCTQQTITVPPDVAAKTRQKHDYPSKSHRRSYARRTGAERTFSTTKDPATNNIAHGWTRLMDLTPITLWLACLLAVRNQRILTAWDARQADDARRAAAGLPPKTRRRRKTLASLAAAAPP